MTNSGIIMTCGVMRCAPFKLMTNSGVIMTGGIVTEAL